MSEIQLSLLDLQKIAKFVAKQRTTDEKAEIAKEKGEKQITLGEENCKGTGETDMYNFVRWIYLFALDSVY